MASAEGLSIEREIAIAARPETVWRLLTDPERASAWWGTAVFDLRPGGPLAIEVVPGRTVRGEFVMIDPPSRLVYTWGWEARDGEPNRVPVGTSIVEIELAPEGDGTRLRLTHRQLPGAETAEAHGHGWDHYLERLAIAAGGRDPGPDPWASPET